MEPLTLTMSKCMVPLANKPMLEWVVETAQAAADKVYIVVRRDQLDIIDHFKLRPGVEFVYQDKPLGTGNALLQAKDVLTNPQSKRANKMAGETGNSESGAARDADFLLMNGDVLTTPDNVAKIAALPAPAIAGFEVPNPQEFGVLNIARAKDAGNGIASEASNASASAESADWKVVGLTEKPSKPTSSIVNAGIYKLNASVFPILESLQKTAREEYELTDALAQLLPMNFCKLSSWVHLTYPWDILEANRFVLDRWGPQLGKAEIRPGACIEQPVAIGEGAVIGPNCYIRAYSSIGAGCKVGNAVEIKNSIIMPHSFVSHLSYVGDSIVGRNCNIAGGTIFANLRLDEKTVKMQIKGKVIDTGRRKLGALVGDGVRFGVNCTVMPGRRIWPGIMIPPCTIIKNDVTKQPSLKSWKRILT